MKKLLRILYIILALGLMIASVCVVSSASSSASAPEGAVWQVTHANGAVDYYYGFAEAFTTISEGDVFKLLPKEYEVRYTSSSDHDFATVRANANITIDLCGSVIYCDATGDVAAQLFNVSSTNGSLVTVLLENTVIYVPAGGRTAFSASGSAMIDMDGGEAGGKIFAPGALNLTANYSDESMCSYIRNLYCYKSSKNMAGMISSRGTSKLKLIDTYAVGPDGNNLPIYVVDAGEIIMENSVGISVGGGDVAKFQTPKSGATLTVGEGSALYGKITGYTEACILNLENGSLFTQDVSAHVQKYTECVGGEFVVPFTYYTSSVVGSYATGNVNLTYLYSIRPSYVLKDEYEEGLFWKLEDSEGNIKYSDSLVPVTNDTDGKYVSLTLLEDKAFTEGITLGIPSEMKIDLSGRTVTLSEEATDTVLISVKGRGTLQLDITNSVIVSERVTFLRAESLRKASVIAGGAYLNVACAVVSDSTDVAVEGGHYSANSGRAFVINDASLTMRALTVLGATISCDEDVTVFEGVNLLPPLGQAAITSEGVISLADGTLISGSVGAKSLFMEGIVRLGGAPETKNSNMLIIEDRTQIDIPVLEKKGEMIENVNKTYTFKYRTAQINENLHFNFEFRSFVTLNVYIPKGIAESSSDFKFRLSVTGLLLDADNSKATDVNIGGKTYRCFSYKYVYPTSYYDDVNLTLISGDFSHTSSRPLSELIERSFTAADEDVKRIIATWAAYALDISASALPTDSPMAEYVREFTPEERIIDPVAKYISYARYDVPNQKLILTPKPAQSGTLTLIYGFGDEQLRYLMPLNEDIHLPIYRLNNGKAISAVAEVSGGTERFMFDLYTLIAFMPADSSSRHDLELYAAYLASIQDALAK
ncbi:MAG: hypothetical protein E7617_07630 [Ruminococcaceae bacterium]|nr:hypothetical protein [Oscillospiraceae bacterium]